jgi:hypothetical protein
VPQRFNPLPRTLRQLQAEVSIRVGVLSVFLYMSAVSIRFGSHSRHFRPGLFQPTGTIGVALATRFQPTGARQRSIIRRRTFQSTLLGLKARLAVLMPERISIRLPHRTTNPRGCMVSIQVAEETIRARCLDRYIVSIHAGSIKVPA